MVSKKVTATKRAVHVNEPVAADDAPAVNPAGPAEDDDSAPVTKKIRQPKSKTDAVAGIQDGGDSIGAKRPSRAVKHTGSMNENELAKGSNKTPFVEDIDTTKIKQPKKDNAAKKVQPEKTNQKVTPKSKASKKGNTENTSGASDVEDKKEIKGKKKGTAAAFVEIEHCTA